MTRPVYLDYNGTPPHAPEVFAAMRPDAFISFLSCLFQVRMEQVGFIGIDYHRGARWTNRVVPRTAFWTRVI